MSRMSIDGNQCNYTDRSGTITTGGTAQTLMAVNMKRYGFFIQNLSTADLYINSLGTASAARPSIKIPAGALYEAPLYGVPVGAISIFGATTAQEFTAVEW